jgi:hypothetical protein
MPVFIASAACTAFMLPLNALGAAMIRMFMGYLDRLKVTGIAS